MKQEHAHWTCPFCNRDTTIGDTNRSSRDIPLSISNADNIDTLRSDAIVCPNPQCKKVFLHFSASKQVSGPNGNIINLQLIRQWQLLPTSKAKPFPDYIPKAV